MALKLSSYIDIINAVREALGVQSSDTIATNKIKRLINMVYLDEVAPAKRWRWLQKTAKVMHDVYYSDTTNFATVTNDSTTVTLNNAPNATLGSFLGYKFAVDGFPEIYEITAHTAAGTAVTIDAQFLGDTSATANFKIWRDRFDLPTNAKETVEITHQRMASSMKAKGYQELRNIRAGQPKAEGYPSFYNTIDFYDPSTGDGETESDRYRQVEIFPAITTKPVTLHVDYVIEVTELDADADEPVMPIGDRIVLYYGALAHAWSVIARDEEMSMKSERQFGTKLARMMGEIEDGFDKPIVAPRSSYLSAIRGRRLNRRNLGQIAIGGESSVASPTYAKDITLEGGNITANFTVDAGITIDGRDISEDGAVLDALTAGTEVTLTDNTTDEVVATWVIATYDVVHIDYSLKRGTAYEAGSLKIISDGSSAAISDGGIAAINDAGVTFTADVNGTSLRLLSTTTSTGASCALQYTESKWKA